MHGKMLWHTVHCFLLELIPALIAVDLVQEVFLWVGDHSDLVVLSDEVSALGDEWETSQRAFSNLTPVSPDQQGRQGLQEDREVDRRTWLVCC